jgi:hypothetical protein
MGVADSLATNAQSAVKLLDHLRIARTRPRVVALVGVMFNFLLLGLSIARGVDLHQVDTLYDPVYRWRQTAVAALSRLRGPSPGMYLGFSDIERVFVSNGFGVLPSERRDPARVEVLQRDGPLLDRILAEAMAVPIVRSSKPVLIRGNDLGWVDFFYLSFRFFGVHVSALFYFYYLLLTASVVAFLMAFWRSPACLYVLSSFLVGHYCLVGYIQAIGGEQIVSVSNSRFYSVPALLPTLHILLAMLRRDKPSFRSLSYAGFQAFLLMFYLFCRLEVVWLLALLLGVGLATLRFPSIWRHLTRRNIGERVRMLSRTWPTMLTLVACVGLGVYVKYVPDKLYRDEVKTHVIWHSLYEPMISVLSLKHRAIADRYLYGKPPFSDNLVYEAVLAELRARNVVISPLAWRANGTIYINPMADMGEYDKIVRTLYFRFIRKHPFLVLESFYDNIELEFVTVSAIMRNAPEELWTWSVALTLSAMTALLFLGWLTPKPERRYIKLSLLAASALLASSLIPAMTVASPLLCGTVLVCLMTPLCGVTAAAIVATKIAFAYGARRQERSSATRITG